MPLSDLVGQRGPTELIARAVARGTLPPSLLFAGPPGVGKWRAACAVAQALNCLQPVEREGGGRDACGACRACDRVARGVHVDVLTLEPDERASIKIDVVREVLNRTGFRPFEGRRRAVLVRDAETLEHAAQNALLKSLEEPPPATVFVLTTALPDTLLPTVRSRCMRLRFGRLTEAEVATILVRDMGYDETRAREAAALADGSVAQALALDSADLASLRDAALGLLRQAAAQASASARLQAAQALHAGGAKKERTRQEVALALRLLASMLRDVEALNAGIPPHLIANPALTDTLSGIQRGFTGDRARAAFAAVTRALTALERNAGIKVVVEWAAVNV